ncbi:AcrR family transcriptional regulator [Agromyces terreus]|uniref:AcrR family transcriptional regulator n=1 Tax=Agromyces terreus TaxID=424795 RepID=A0A9X2H6T3_9MICO|nr:TetR/AcrR family transcriptional regulator [Agromyces terreus]MCP2371837.1 AcrR family transcriptional regulator [Agromyces terreus]
MTDTVRPPRQARSRDAWERVLAVGLDLLQTDGYEGLTVGEVCRRAKVSAPSIYARVDGLSGLVLAVYERGMTAVAATEDRRLAASDGTIEDVVGAMAAVFAEHRALLRAVISRAAADPALLTRGAVLSRAVIDRFAAALDSVQPEQALTLMRAVYTECSFRAMYGSTFWSDEDETDEAFVARLIAFARRLADGTAAP